MDVTHQTDNNEQTALWNGRAGRAWVLFGLAFAAAGAALGYWLLARRRNSN